MILAGLGRYGPYVQHGKSYANVESIEDVFSIGLNRAVTVLAEKAAGKGARFGRGAQQRDVLKDLGPHPSGEGKIEILNGRYGPYITHGGVNANVPRGKEPVDVTVEEAVMLLAERAAKGGGKSRFGKGKAKKAAAPKAANDEGGGTTAKKPSKAKKPAKAARKDAAE
jgi:DNA topoisomerase I